VAPAFINNAFMNNPFMNNPFINNAFINNAFINNAFINNAFINSYAKDRPNSSPDPQLRLASDRRLRQVSPNPPSKVNQPSAGV
jgi:hypothetical protein